MLAIILAATLYSTTEADVWASSAVAPVDSARDATALFATDGETPRAGTVPGEAKITITPEGLKPVELKVSIGKH